MIFRTKEAQEEYERSERVNRILQGGGCWLTNTDKDGKECLGARVNGIVCCVSCEAYHAFYGTAEYYQQLSDVNTWAEAMWLAKQFYGIKDTYMCDGYDGEWYKEHDPKKYAALLKRQKELMDGTPDEPEELEEEPAPKATGQMSIMDWFAENN